jgi:hypothetical protein
MGTCRHGIFEAFKIQEVAGRKSTTILLGGGSLDAVKPVGEPPMQRESRSPRARKSVDMQPTI